LLTIKNNITLIDQQELLSYSGLSLFFASTLVTFIIYNA
jgi:hypothetical protein